MNYARPELRRALASDYVVGGMNARVRRRFERLLRSDVLLRAEVQAWEDTLYPLLDHLPIEQQPPPRVWAGIVERLGLQDAPESSSTGTGTTAGDKAAPGAASRPSESALAPAFESVQPRPVVTPTTRPAGMAPAWPTRGWRGRVGFWQSATALATAAALCLAIAVGALYQPRPDAPPVFTAVIGTDELRVGWLVRSLGDPRISDTVALNVVSISDHDIDTSAQSYQLWLLPAPGRGDAPVPLGLMPAIGEDTVRITREQFDELPKAAGLAVSLEPFGGSPTGQPTGPITATALSSRMI